MNLFIELVILQEAGSHEVPHIFPSFEESKSLPMRIFRVLTFLNWICMGWLMAEPLRSLLSELYARRKLFAMCFCRRLFFRLYFWYREDRSCNLLYLNRGCCLSFLWRTVVYRLTAWPFSFHLFDRFQFFLTKHADLDHWSSMSYSFRTLITSATQTQPVSSLKGALKVQQRSTPSLDWFVRQRVLYRS